MPFEELALPPHGYHMAVTWLSHGSYSDHCYVTASPSHYGSIRTCGVQTIPHVRATLHLDKATKGISTTPTTVSKRGEAVSKRVKAVSKRGKTMSKGFTAMSKSITAMNTTSTAQVEATQ